MASTSTRLLRARYGDPDIIFISGWNDWQYANQIEPAVEYGYRYVDLAASLLGRSAETAPYRRLVGRIGGWKGSMMEQAAPCTMVIFGASGDLTVRKLIPGLYELHGRGLLPERFAVLGAGAYRDERRAVPRQDGGGAGRRLR